MKKPPECTRSKRYTFPDRFATEHSVTKLVGSLVEALKPDYVLEVGAYHGHTTRAIGEALKRNACGTLDAIEIDIENVQEINRNVQNLPVNLHHSPFQNFQPKPNVTYDFVFIDGAGTQRGVDLERVLTMVQAGSIIAIHDTSKRFKTFELIEPILKREQNNIRSIFLPTLRGIGLLEVMA